MNTQLAPPTDQSPRYTAKLSSKARLDEWLDDALEDTFPASDPIASPLFGGVALTERDARSAQEQEDRERLRKA